MSVCVQWLTPVYTYKRSYDVVTEGKQNEKSRSNYVLVKYNYTTMNRAPTVGHYHCLNTAINIYRYKYTHYDSLQNVTGNVTIKTEQSNEPCTL